MIDNRKRTEAASRAASRARTLRRLRRLAAELREKGWTVIEPEQEKAA